MNVNSVRTMCEKPQINAGYRRFNDILIRVDPRSPAATPDFGRSYSDVKSFSPR